MKIHTLDKNLESIPMLESPSNEPSTTLDEEVKNIAEDYPEGGTQAWAAVLGSFCLVFLTQGAVATFGVYQDFYTRIFLSEKTPSEIAWIGSMQLFLIFGLGLFSGKLFDEGYIRQTLLIGSIIYLFSFFMLSLAQPHHYYQVFLAQGLGCGLGMGLLYIPSISICFHYFRKKRAFVSGLASLGGSVGAIAQTIGLNHMFNGPIGFAWGVRIYGFIFLVLAIVGNLLIKPRLPPRKQRTGIPPPNIKKVLKDIPFLMAIFGASLILFALYFPYFFIQLFAVLHGISTNLAFYLITIMIGANIFGRVIWGIIADKYGVVNAIIGTSTLLGVVSFALIRATDVTGLVLFAIFYGFFSGGFLALIGPTTAAFVDSITDFGFAIGYASFIQSFFVLVAEPIAGLLLDAPRYRWNRAIIFASIILFIGVLFALVSRSMLLKRTGRDWKT